MGAATPGEIRIDPHAVRESVSALRHEHEAGPQVSANEFRRTMGWTVQFGQTNPSHQVRAARRLSERALTQAYVISQEHTAAAEMLVAAGEKILEQYEHADALGAADAAAVDAALYAAVADVERTRRDDDRRFMPGQFE